MQQIAGEGPTNLPTWLSLGPTSSLILSLAHQYCQDGDKKVGYLMQEPRPYQAPQSLLQDTNTLLPLIFPKSSSYLSNNSEPKSPFPCRSPGKPSISKFPPWEPKHHSAECFKIQPEVLAA